MGALALSMPTGALAQTIIHDNGNVEFGITGRGFLAGDLDIPAGIIAPNFRYPAGDPNARQYLEQWSGIWVGGDVGPVASHLDIDPVIGVALGEWLPLVTGAPEDVSSAEGRQTIRAEFGAAPTETSDLPFTVFIEQVTHTWAEGPESNGVVFIMTMTNQSDLPAENLRMGFATNWDVDPQINETGKPSRDLAMWDDRRQASIMFQGDPAGVDSTHVATVLLQGDLFAHRISPFLPQTPWTWPDTDRSNFLGSPQVMRETLTAGNRQTITVAGPVTLDGLAAHTFVFALVGGETRGDLERNIDAVADVIRRPQAVQTSVNDDGVQLLWEPPISAQIFGYAVLRSLEEGGPYDQVGPRIVQTVEYLDRNVVPGTTYYYRIHPVDLDEKIVNTPSEPATATTSPKPTAVSTLAIALEGTPATPEVALTFSTPANVDARDVDLLLLRNETGLDPFTIIQQGRYSEELSDVEVEPGRTYYYAVRLVNEFDRLSDLSNVVRVEVPLPVAAPSLDLGRVAVYPNPVRRSQSSALHFRNLPVGTTIRFYTATGQLIDRADNQSISIYDWTPGPELANGVYVYQIEWAPEAVSRDPATAPRDTLLKRVGGKFVLMD
ncbi:hypothetical protein CMK11_14275 [Candidatus Poribacteria bacterium]|nr:hypothetical protein [Candidatus Poribacteria bacterium]